LHCLTDHTQALAIVPVVVSQPVRSITTIRRLAIVTSITCGAIRQLPMHSHGMHAMHDEDRKFHADWLVIS